MRRLLFSSTLLIFVACGTSEDSIDTSEHRSDSLDMNLDSMDVIMEDTIRRIEHGSPDQEKLDSIKNAKKEEKNKYK